MHTVIVAVSINDSDAWAAVQIALVDASVRQGVKRFAPSEFNVSRKHDDPLIWYRPKAVVADYVRKSGLEYTFFETGLFMSAIGPEGLGHIGSHKFVIDIGKCTAQIPGDGNAKVAMTRVEDIGLFVAASLELDKWPEVSRMAGDVKSYNEIVRLAEAARGMSAFHV